MTPKPISEIQRVVDTVDKFRGVHAGNENTYLFRLKDALDSISSALCVMNMKIEGKTIELQPKPVATLCEVAQRLSDYLDSHNTDNSHALMLARNAVKDALTAERKRAELVERVIRSLQLVPEKYRSECQNSALAALEAFDKGAENG